MSAFMQKEGHLQMVYKNNVVFAKDGDRIIIVHSKRTIKPLLPFEISKQVLDQWKKRDNRIAITETPYKELFGATINGNDELVKVVDFNDIEFSEH
jgi:hypothetical protein